MLDVCLLGTSGMMPLPGRPLTALMSRFNGSSLLIDCGEGTQVAIRQKGWSFHSIDIICITHFHGDHVAGLPGLLLSMGNADRVEPITIVGPKGIERVVNSLRIIAPELPFEIKYIELTAKEQTIEGKGYYIEAFRVNHNVVCYGYDIVVKRTGKFMVDRAIAAGVPQNLWNRLQKGEEIELEGVKYTPDMVLGKQRKGLKVTYCTDSRPTETIAKHAENADLFICEGMYGEDEKLAKAVENKHMTFNEAAQLANEASVKELWLTHYSPSLIRPEDYMTSVRSRFENAKAGKPGMSRELEFPKEE